MNLINLFAAIPLAGLLVLSAAGTAHAQSCGMGDIDWYAKEREAVSRADLLLQQGESQKAALGLQEMWPQLSDAVPVAGSIQVIADGVRLMALAAVRSDGDVKSVHGWSSWTATERARNVAWGVRRLRMLVKADPTSTLAKTDLGEALARAPETRKEASALLETLAKTHSIGSAEGYAALALLRTEEGDAAGAEEAGLQCDRMATNVTSQCTTAGGRVTPMETAAR